MENELLQPFSHTSSSSGCSNDDTPTPIHDHQSRTLCGSGSSSDQRPKKRGRRSHTKSRSGCFSCKKARIKCHENRPTCDFCAHRGLKCEWPQGRDDNAGSLIKRLDPSRISVLNPHLPGPIFAAEDFRLFHHFVKSAYPNHPMGNESVWTHEIPCIASDHDFLLHAMLALAASDIAASRQDPSLYVTAVRHRVKSIEAFNQAVSTGVQTFEQGNAMIATCFTLLYQSTRINDGLAEFITFLRGIVAIAMQMGKKKMNFMFTRWFGEEQLEMIDPALQSTPLLQADVVLAACNSLESMAPLCQAPVEFSMHSHLISLARMLATSSREAYVKLQKVYERYINMSFIDFRHFVDPSNQACQLLQAHFVALQLIMAPIAACENPERKTPLAENSGNPGRPTGKWLQNIHQGIPNEMKRYYSWTLWVEDAVYNRQLIEKSLMGERIEIDR